MLEEHGANIEVQVKDHYMEEDNHANNTVEYDGTNTLIQDTFSFGMDDDRNDYDDVHHIYLYLRGQDNLFMKDPKQLFCLLYCCWST